MKELEKIINDAWENKEKIDQNSDASILNAVNERLEKLDLSNNFISDETKAALRNIAEDKGFKLEI